MMEVKLLVQRSNTAHTDGTGCVDVSQHVCWDSGVCVSECETGWMTYIGASTCEHL